MNPVFPARTSTSVRPSRWFVLWNEIGRLPLKTVYSDIRMIDEMRSSCEACVISRAISYAVFCLKKKKKHVCAGIIKPAAALTTEQYPRKHSVDHSTHDKRAHLPL